MEIRPGEKTEHRSRKSRPALFGLLILLLALPAPVSAQPAESRRILILNSYHQVYFWTDGIMQGINDIFAARNLRTDFFVENMDSKRFFGGLEGEYVSRLKEIYRNKYKNIHFDIIISSDDNALLFLLANRDELFPGAPIVFCGVNNFDDSLLAGHTGITGVVETLDREETIDTALILHPGTKRVALVTDTATTGAANREQLKRLAARYAPAVELLFLDHDGTGLTFDQLLEKVAALPKDSIIFYSDFHIDRNGRNFDDQRLVAEKLSQASGLPIYTNYSSVFGSGTVGGKLNNPVFQGRSAAEMALRILNGEPVADIPVEKQSPNRFMFQYNQLDTFNLLDKNLPEGSIIVDRPITFYEKNRAKVWGTAILLALQAIIIFLLVRALRQRKHAARELVRWNHIFANAQWGLAVADPYTERIIDINPAFARMHGCEIEDLVNSPVKDIYAPEVRPELTGHLREIQEKGHYRFESIHLRKDGSSFPVAVAVATIKDEQGSPLYRVVNVEDITLSKETTGQLQQSLARLSALNSLAARIVSTPSFTELSQAVLHELVEVTGADFSILYVMRNGDLEPVHSHSRPPFSRGSETEPHQVGLCLCGLAAHGRPVYSDNIHSDPRCSLSECKNAGLRSFAALPLLKGDRIIGVLGVASLKERRFSQEADFLETLAGQTALGVENALLYDQIKNHATDLEKQVLERTRELEERNSELERLNRLFVDREFRIKELRDEVKRLGGKVTE